MSDQDGFVALESQDGLDRLQKLFRYAQVGRCVNSVTHDVNNFLGAVLAYAELVDLDSDLSPESQRMIGEIVEAVRKCSNLLSVLTGVARKDKPNVSVVSPVKLVRDVLDLRRYDIKVAQVQLDEDLASYEGSMALDPPKIELALVYIISNAIEAVAGAKDRRMKVKLLAQDDAIEIAIWNSGPAIADDDRERIFEPLYSTKGEEHLGLGLSVARQMIEYHSGTVVYEPERGFVVRLPKDNKLLGSAIQ